VRKLKKRAQHYVSREERKSLYKHFKIIIERRAKNLDFAGTSVDDIKNEKKKILDGLNWFIGEYRIQPVWVRLKEMYSDMKPFHRYAELAAEEMHEKDERPDWNVRDLDTFNTFPAPKVGTSEEARKLAFKVFKFNREIRN
jgi:hypothetical protein